MKSKFMTKLLATVMAAAVVVTAVPATAMAAPVYNKSQVLYMTSGTYTSYNSISVSNLKKSQTIEKSSVKSSNEDVAQPYAVGSSTSEYSYRTDYMEKNMKPNQSSSKYYSGSISLKLAKAGKTTVSFKIKGVKGTQKVNIQIKKYTNPVKSLKISGINGDLKNKTKSSTASSYLKLNKTVSNASVKVTAAKGWKISEVSVYDTENERYTRINSYSKPFGSGTLYLGKLEKNKQYRVSVEFTNPSDGGSLSCYYYINQSNSYQY